MAMTSPILLVDDNAEIREALSLTLRSAGYEVTGAANGKVALQQLRDGLHPCLILCDLVMPTMNGYELREELLRDPTLRQIPFVATSGVTDVNGNSTHIQPDACLQKPVQTSVLLSTVSHYALKA